MNYEEFKVIDLDAIWADEIYPLIRKDQLFADLWANVLDRIVVPCRDEYIDIWKSAPHWFARTDHWEMEVQRRFEEAADKGYEEAVRYQNLWNESCGEDGYNSEEGWAALAAAEKLFAPKEHEADWFRSFGHCHAVVHPMRYAAHLWKPDGEWEILEGDLHSTVISKKHKLAFDILVTDPHPVLFATQKEGEAA